jgi:hypothetical protein
MSITSSVVHEESQIRISMFPEESVNISGLRSVRWHWHPSPSKYDFSTNLVFTPLIRTEMMPCIRAVAPTATDVNSVGLTTV